MLRIHNSLGNRKVEFKPLKEGEVNMYLCGVTVYDTVHVGHARSYVNFDLIRRYFEYSGYDITLIQNFTDIDDKIIERSKRENRDWRELTGYYIGEYFRLLDRIGIKRASEYPRASHFIPKMIEMISALIKSENAYVTKSGDVYFDVSSFSGYGALVSKARLEQATVSRIASNERKRSEVDFALWKSAKPGEPHWASPWGNGRPGWHIECSAMSHHYFGDTFDIHAGGLDLIFPHHTNEIAQSESYTGAQMANYWLHNGFIKIDGEKMSKSLGNFISLEDAIDRHGSAALRMFFLRTHYRSPLSFDIEMVDESAAALNRFAEAISDAQTVLEHIPYSADEPNKAGRKLKTSLDSLDGKFREKMDDDFNSAAALGELFEHAQHLFSYVRSCSAPNSKGVNSELLSNASGELERLLGVLGFVVTRRQYDESALGNALKAAGFPLDKRAPLQFALDTRNRLRIEKKFDEADRVRKIITQTTGLQVKDWPFGSAVALLRIETEPVGTQETK